MRTHLRKWPTFDIRPTNEEDFLAQTKMNKKSQLNIVGTFVHTRSPLLTKRQYIPGREQLVAGLSKEGGDLRIRTGYPLFFVFVTGI